ncbi:hypothetical protein RHMOL_Rhmol01G0140300 [Rhododendron molle]|uniref:Uncharacterized protein n=1 Tax=Rhododendron molle TaxID=49168 RepID=A0ACC0Q1K6_RHOML|nr:hypothetical protein RHMOL_Rhmol01G0140300 [Rhododendron molle]
MDEPEEPSSTNPNAKPLCEECKLKPSKYKCPGCSTRSCSLPCVKAHKQRTGCTGKRQQTQFVPLSHFDDNLLLSDYNMLEDVKRVADSAQRMRLKLGGYPHFRLPFPLKSLWSAAASRRTKLLFLPSGMSKRETNQSYYNNRKKFISWSIEWRFHATDVVLIDHRVNESKCLCSVIENHLKPSPWNHNLKQFCEEPLDSLKFFIRKYPKLANLVILEYPVIHAFLPSHPCDFEVIKDAIPQRMENNQSLSSNHPSPKGVTFREEEIEDDPSPNPQVLDLMKCSIPSKDKVIEKEFHEKLDTPLLETQAREAQDNLHCSSTKTTNAGVFEDTDFDFEQGLIDAYSDLIAQTNPDDFLDWEGMFPEEVGPGERRDNPDFSRGIPVEDEELEEGEIPG